MSDVRKLKEMFAELSKVNEFKPGDLVVWKPGLRDRKIPGYGEAVVVVSTTPGLVVEDSGSGDQYFRAPLDLQCGVIDDAGDFSIYHFDSRRFQHAASE